MKLQPIDDLVDHFALGAHGQADQIEVGDHKLAPDIFHQTSESGDARPQWGACFFSAGIRSAAQRTARLRLSETMTLEELRKARALSQEEVAEALAVNQPAVAKLEKRGDMHVSNLRRYIEALGGTLEITAHFDKTTVVISNVGET